MESTWRWSAETERVLDEVVATRRDIHAHPELGLQERRTAGLVGERLRALGLEVRTGVGVTGVVGLVEGGRPGPTVMLRADMDALPLQETGDVPYASQVPGVMHACGHDAHTAMLLGVARILAGQRAELAGRVKLVFQPAEEGGGGARLMVADGVLRQPAVSAAFGLHVWNSLPIGTIGILTGPLMAATDALTLRVRGRGGHAASPHEAVDPIITAAHFLMAAQTAVSRSTDPVRPAVFTVGSIHGGEARNIIPEEVVLEGTLRTLDAGVRERMLRRLEAILQGVTAAHGGDYVFDHRPGYPVTVSDAACAELAREVSREVVGAERVVAPPPTMGGEDMSYYLQEVPGCYLWLGSANAAKGLAQPHHNPRFDFDERAMGIGVEVLVRLARRALEHPERCGGAPAAG
ncbi:MAG: amidohydrolase [Armatimonadetes bacterium]|nr:amidohydrolase [Armatimonadota bacterium]